MSFSLMIVWDGCTDVTQFSERRAQTEKWMKKLESEILTNSVTLYIHSSIQFQKRCFEDGPYDINWADWNEKSRSFFAFYRADPQNNSSDYTTIVLAGNAQQIQTIFLSDLFKPLVIALSNPVGNVVFATDLVAKGMVYNFRRIKIILRNVQYIANANDWGNIVKKTMKKDDALSKYQIPESDLINLFFTYQEGNAITTRETYFFKIIFKIMKKQLDLCETVIQTGDA